MQMLPISARHLSLATLQYLTAGATVVRHEHGWIAFVATAASDAPRDLRDILNLSGAHWLNFDDDAPRLACLPVFADEAGAEPLTSTENV